jgi:hypothetical protein
VSNEPLLPPPANAAPSSAASARVRLFEERYGGDAHAELTALFARPCVTYAHIAAHFGVTRERVRQWHLTFAPNSPRGHERRRLCQIYQRKRRLLHDPLYRAFVRAVRTQLPDLLVQPVPGQGGFRKRLVRMGAWTVALKKVGPLHRDGHGAMYALTASRQQADYVFFQLAGASFLFLPSSVLPRGGTNYVDVPTSKYSRFTDGFIIVPSTVRDEPMTANLATAAAAHSSGTTAGGSGAGNIDQ